jgi:hypothetical protein
MRRTAIGATANVPVTFGIVNSTNDPRIMQLAAKLYWQARLTEKEG